MRHRHLIRRIRGCSYPTAIICLDVDVMRSRSHSSPNRETETLSGWAGIGVSGVGGVYCHEVRLSGTDAESLWQSLAMRLRRGGVIWCFSERASRVWTLLGLWERIEDGYCRILGHEIRAGGRVHQGAVPILQGHGMGGEDERSKGSTAVVQSLPSGGKDANGTAGRIATARGSGRNGVCIIEDPPIVIDVRISGLPGRLRIVDTANYGLVPSVGAVSAADRVSRAVRFIAGMIGTLKTEGLGSLKTTVASQAAASWKFAHHKYPVLVHDDVRATNLEEECLYGGRCEATHIGRIDDRIYHLDVSSMYTSLCAGASLPSCLAGFSDLATGINLNTLLQSHAVLASVRVRTDENAYPYHDRRVKLTIWPVGEFDTCLAGPELEDAYSRGRIVRWYKIAWYERSPFLSSFACKMLALRQQFAGNADLRTWSKCMGVSIVGKMGQKARYWADDRTNIFHKAWDSFYLPNSKNGVERWRSIAGYTQREIVAGYSFDAVPAAGAWVTSLGRMLLLRLIRAAQPCNVVYCDTDSLMVLEPGYQELLRRSLIRDGVAGELRIVDVWDGVDIRGIKDYIGGGKHVQAGRPLEADAQESGTGKVWISPRVKGACRSKARPIPGRVQLPFLPREIYRHGSVLPDGSVRPHILGEE